MFEIALAQCRRPDDGDVAGNVGRWVARAVAEDADLVVFPEALMMGYDGSPERFAAAAEPADGPFSRAIDAIATAAGLWVVYTMNERNPEGGMPFNTAIVTGPDGIQRGRYRKVHLFDKQGENESGHMAAGTEPFAPVDAPFARIGLAICYDLRFPEVSQAAAQAGAQLMLYPSAWVAGPNKVDQWKELLRERAVENGMFVAGCSSVDANRTGHSAVFAPDGTELASAGGEEELLVCTIDLDFSSRLG